ncbi:MAG: DUF6879 family protein [Pseudonocardiaceae bacterium]
MLTDTEFGEIMSSARRSLFRLETLDRYEVPIDGSDMSVYLSGGDQPYNAEKLAWEEHLRAERTAGIWRHRVHLIDTTHGLEDYLRYACEWGYAATTSAGEGVRLLDLADTPQARHLIEIDHDFWLIDGERVVRMHYAADATFVGGELMPADTVPSYRAAREIAWTRAEDFTSWWTAHPQYHRAHHHVA